MSVAVSTGAARERTPRHLERWKAQPGRCEPACPVGLPPDPHALQLVLRARGFLDVNVSGVSMAPLLEEGDAVRVTPAEGVGLGDVCLVGSGAGFVLHRVVRTKGETLVLQGDHARDVTMANPREVVGVASAVKVGGAGVWHSLQDGPRCRRALARVSYATRYGGLLDGETAAGSLMLRVLFSLHRAYALGKRRSWENRDGKLSERGGQGEGDGDCRGA